jgi:Ribose 5-phosphate isomerase RpiB
MKVGIVADGAGFELKRKLVSLLMIEGYSVVDFGNKLYDNERDYPEAWKI